MSSDATGREPSAKLSPSWRVILKKQFTSPSTRLVIPCSNVRPFRSQLNTALPRVHFGGALLCLMGLSCIVVSDALDAVQAAKHGDDTEYPHAVWGDLLCISGAVGSGP